MKNLIIIGARGFGRTIFNLAKECSGYNKEYIIKGFLDDKSDALNGFSNYPPIINSVENYIIENKDIFICALGDVYYKKKYIEIIENKGGLFTTLIHPSAHIESNVKIGRGCIILSACSIGCDTILDNHITLQVASIIGHDVYIGCYSVLDCFTFLGGFVKLGNCVAVHTGAKVIPKLNIGDNVMIGVGSIVLRNINDNISVFGNPAKRVLAPNKKN